MQTQKMSLANIKGKLSRAEMKNIMAGSDDSEAGCIAKDSNCGRVADGTKKCCAGLTCTAQGAEQGSACK